MIDMLALILSVIGCVNWGLIGFFQFNLVTFLFGGGQDGYFLRRSTVQGAAGVCRVLRQNLCLHPHRIRGLRFLRQRKQPCGRAYHQPDKGHIFGGHNPLVGGRRKKPQDSALSAQQGQRKPKHA